MKVQELIDSAMCSRRERRFWHRQAAAYVAALGNFGLLNGDSTDSSSVEVGRRQLDNFAANLRVDADIAGIEVLGGKVLDSDAAISDGSILKTSSGTGVAATLKPKASSKEELRYADDTALYLAKAVPFLASRVAAADLPLAVLAAIEAVVDAPSPILAEAAAQGCPLEFTGLLHESFALFQRGHPWVRHDRLQPKGLAVEMVAKDLTFADLVESLVSRGYGPVALNSEGALLRYLNDVYRMFRFGLPVEYRSEELMSVGKRLRRVVEEVDSSLLKEWEASKASDAVVGGNAPQPNERSGSGFARDVGGAMLPGGPSSEDAHKGRPHPRSRGELSGVVRKLRTELEIARKAREKQAALTVRHPWARLRRWSGAILSSVVRALDEILDRVW